MRQKITEKVNTTPQDVKNILILCQKIALPTYNKEIEVGEIVFSPKLNKEEKEFYKQKAEDLRASVKKGEDFGTISQAYTHRIRVRHQKVATWAFLTVLLMLKSLPPML
jgi:peptidyl-prolyl cis-trans isomerase SurA